MGVWRHGCFQLRLRPGPRALLLGLLVLSGLAAASGSVRAQDDGQTCTGDLATLRAEINARRQRVAQSCAPAVELMQSLLLAKQRYSRALVSANQFRGRCRAGHRRWRSDPHCRMAHRVRNTSVGHPPTA